MTMTKSHQVSAGLVVLRVLLFLTLTTSPRCLFTTAFSGGVGVAGSGVSASAVPGERDAAASGGGIAGGGVAGGGIAGGGVSGGGVADGGVAGGGVSGGGGAAAAVPGERDATAPGGASPLPDHARLDRNLVPVHYNVDLQPHIYTGDDFSFSGNARVWIK